MTTGTTTPRRQRTLLVPIGLVALSAIPLVAGTLRVVQLAGGPELIPADQRFDAFPAPLFLHIIGAAIYVLVGVLQFVPRFRRRHRTWHRRAGRVLVVAGLHGRRVGAVDDAALRARSPAPETCSTSSG